MIDQNRDGVLDADDLAAIYQQIGEYLIRYLPIDRRVFDHRYLPIDRRVSDHRYLPIDRRVSYHRYLPIDR